MKISNNIDDNIREFKRVYSDCSDIKMQEMYVGKNGKLKCFLAYIEVTLPGGKLADSAFSKLSDFLMTIDEENVKKAEKGSLAAGLFQEDELSQGTFVSRKTFATPPAGFDLNSSDLSTPAIWGKNSEYGRTINLSDD